MKNKHRNWTATGIPSFDYMSIRYKWNISHITLWGPETYKRMGWELPRLILVHYRHMDCILWLIWGLRRWLSLIIWYSLYKVLIVYFHSRCNKAVRRSVLLSIGYTKLCIQAGRSGRFEVQVGQTDRIGYFPSPWWNFRQYDLLSPFAFS